MSDSERKSPTPSAEDVGTTDAPVTMDDRKAKLEQLRLKMVCLDYGSHASDAGSWSNADGLRSMCMQRSSAQANRGAVVAEAAAQKVNAREIARLDRQRKLAETLREKVRL